MDCTRLAQCAFNRRTVDEIKENVDELSGRGAFSRLLHSKDDKGRIATWRLKLTEVLHVFNVRSITSLFTFLTIAFQTKLALNTHGAVSDIRRDVVNTQNIVSNIHRTIAERQEVADSGNASVGSHCTLFITERILTVA